MVFVQLVFDFVFDWIILSQRDVLHYHDDLYTFDIQYVLVFLGIIQQ